MEEACSWVNIDLPEDSKLSEKVIQKWIDEEFNKPEYNIFQRETRHIRLPKIPYRNEDSEEFTGDVMDMLADNSQEVEQNKKEELVAIQQWLERFLKPKEVEMFMIIKIKGMAIKDYAVLIGAKPDTVTKKLTRLKNKIKKNYEKCPI